MPPSVADAPHASGEPVVGGPGLPNIQNQLAAALVGDAVVVWWRFTPEAEATPCRRASPAERRVAAPGAKEPVGFRSILLAAMARSIR